MSYHPFSFENLADWLDGRLDERESHAIEAHIAQGCPQCEADLAWLRRVQSAARFHDWEEPPAEAIAAAKGLYRDWLRRTAPQPERRRIRNWVPRLALAVTASLLVLASAAIALSQIPGLIPRYASLTARTGTVESRRLSSGPWVTVPDQSSLPEGSQVRVSEGEAMITLFDGSALLIHSDSELGLETLRSGLTGATRQIAIRQLSGAVEYDVAALGNSRSSFRADTPTACFIVRGTRFVVTVGAETATQLTVFEGSVHVEVLEGSVEVSSPVTEAVLTHDEAAVVGAAEPIVLLPTLTAAPITTVAAAEAPTSTSAPTITDQPLVSATVSSAAASAETERPARSATPNVSVSTATAVAEATGQPGATSSPTAVAAPPEPSRTASPTQVAEPTAALSPTLAPAPPTAQPAILQEPPLTTFGGRIQSFPRALIGQWTIGGQTVWVTHFTQIKGRPEIGLSANVTARSLSARVLVATVIDVLSSGGARTVAPTITNTPTSTPRTAVPPTWTPATTPTTESTSTVSSGVEPSATGTEEPLPTMTLDPTETPVPGPTSPPHDTATTQPIRTPRESRTLVSTGQPHDTPTPFAARTPRTSPTPVTESPTPVNGATMTPVQESTATDMPTATPTEPIPPTRTRIPTRTIAPTPTRWTPLPSPTSASPTVERWKGKISQMPNGRLGPWMVGGRIVQVTSSTSIQGRPAIGLTAEVEAEVGGAIPRARSIVVVNSP
jgi:hypothetical protein